MKSKVIAKIKEENKALVARIKEYRKDWNHKPHSLCQDYRHRHIAYCLLRGRTLEEIETPGYNYLGERKNPPNKKKYEAHLAVFTEALEKERAERLSEGAQPNA